MKTIQWTALVAGALVLQCEAQNLSSADDTSGSSTDTESDSDEPQAGDCADALSPIDLGDHIEIVGQGTPATCSESALRDAVDSINALQGGAIVFSCGQEHTIEISAPLELASAQTSQILIDGEDRITISGGEVTRIFDLDHYTNLVLQRLTLADGFVADDEPDEQNKPSNSGAAIRHPWFGTLKAIGVRFENNHCQSREGEIGGGAVFAGGLTEAVFSGCTFVNNSASNGGALLNRGSNLTIINSVFLGNGALSVGEGQYGNGGAVYIDGMNYENPGGDLTVCGTIFEDNTAMTHGSGMFSYFYEGSQSTIENCVFKNNHFGNPQSGSGGLYHEAAPLFLSSTTFADNVTGEHAAGLFLGSNSSAVITNCTFAGNRVTTNGAAIFNGSSTAEITNCTFTENEADYGPAIFKGQSAEVTLKNTIMADNSTPNEYSATSCHEALIDGGGNLQWPQTKNNGNPDQPCTTGIVFADPLLGELGDNGGMTPTVPLRPESPAIDFADDCPSVDQRGLPRVGRCDCGAYEFQETD